MDRDRYDTVFCVDCDRYRKQKLKGRNINDGILLYVCTECGCENSHSHFRSSEHWTQEQRENIMNTLLKDKE